MTSIPFCLVDASAEWPLTGNLAAVMPLERWLDDALMQRIAIENCVSEIAFTETAAFGWAAAARNRSVMANLCRERIAD